LVDIYLCTYEDFRRFCRFPDTEPAHPDRKAVRDQLATLAKSLPLAFFTVIRGDDLPDRTKAYVVSSNGVTEASLQSSETISNGYFFSKLMFDAGFLHALMHNDVGCPLEARIVSAATEGLAAWSRQADAVS
jgi:hypothetical protein